MPADSPIPTEGGKSAAERVSQFLDYAIQYAGSVTLGDAPQQNVTYRDIRAVLEQRAALLEAAQTVLAGLNERIDTAPLSAVPVFAGIADLHSAILQATGGEDVRR